MSTTPPRRYLPEALIAALFLGLVAMRYRTAEDAWISFRYAHNLAAGRGLVFNQAGPPVEGYSNLLWTLIAAVPERLGLPTQHVMNALSITAGLVCLAELHRAARLHLGASDRTAQLTLLLCLGVPGFSFWATSGLEVMPQTLLFFTVAVGLAFEADPRRTGWICAAAAGLTLIRSEGALWVPVLAGLGAAVRRAHGRPLGPVLPAVATTAVVVVALLTWRQATYGQWVPNTTLAKADLGAVSLIRGARYVASFVLVELPLILLPWAWWRAARRDAATGAWLALAGVAVPAWAAVVGGDYMAHFRFTVPAIPLLALGAVAWLEDLGPRRATLAAACVAALCSASAVRVNLVPERVLLALSWQSEHPKADRMKFVNGTFQLSGSVPQRKDAQALALIAAPGHTITSRMIGNVGYFNPDVDVLDLCGLTSRKVARREVKIDLSDRPGHDKCTDPSVFLSDRPDIIDWWMIRDPDRPAAEVLSTARRLDDALPAGHAYAPRLLRLPPDLMDRPTWLLYFARADGDEAAAESRAFYRELAAGRLPGHKERVAQR
jgi:hypothetical protein